MPTPREELASILKKARIEAGFDSHAALAKQLHMSRPVISKAENITQPIPSDALLAAWAGVTGAPLDPLTELVRRARSGTPEWFMPYLTAEAEADTVRCWAALVFPGLFQTEDYARAVLAVEPYTPENLTQLLATRMERQRVLDRAYITVVIDAHVLQRCIGSPAVMAEQCAHVLTVAQRPNAVLHVVPEGTNIGLYGAFDIAARDNMCTVRYDALEDVTGSSAGTVNKAIRSFERILGTALPYADSLDFTREMESQWKTRAGCSGASPATAAMGAATA